MNKTKRGLQLAAAITSIAFSGLLALGSIYLLSMLKDLEVANGGALEGASTIRAIYICVMLFAAATIIVCSFICAKPKNGTHKGLCITALVLNAVLAVLYLYSGSFYAVCPIVCVGLFIAALCVKGKNAVVTEENTNVVEEAKPEESQPQE